MGGGAEALLMNLCQDYCSNDTKKQMDAHKALIPYVQDPQSSELRNQLLSYIQRLGPSLVLVNEDECLSSIIRLFCRVVRLQWLEGPEYQRVQEEISPMLKSSTTTQGWIVGIMVLLELTRDFSYTTSAKDRRQACSFKNLALPTIVVTAIETVQKFLDGTLGIQDNQESLTLVKNVLLLSYEALRFDYLGTLGGGAADDDDETLGSLVMLPVSIAIVRDAQSMRLYTSMFSAFYKLQNPLGVVCGEICLQCITQIAALRPSYFKKTAQREDHILTLIKFVQDVLSPNNVHILNMSTKTFHHFCVLLFKITTIIPLQDLKTVMHPPVANPRFATLWTGQDIAFIQWLETICEFTLSCLSDWTHNVSSRHYLLKFWAKLVSGSVSGRLVVQNLAIRSMLAKILRGYIECCLKIGELTALIDNQDELASWAESNRSALLFDINTLGCSVATATLPDELEDPLTSDSFRADLMDTISKLASGVFNESVEMVTAAWDACASFCECNKLPKVLLQKRFAWLTYIVASIFQALSISQTRLLFTKEVSSPSSNEEDMETQPSITDSTPYDAAKPLASRVFALMGYKYSFLPEGSVDPGMTEHIELAYLAFMDSYRRTYFTDEKRRMEASLDSGESVLLLITQKIIHNIAFRSAYPVILSQSLKLLDELTLGVVMRTTSDKTSFVFCGKLLLRLPVIQSLLKMQNEPGQMPYYHQLASSLHPIRQGRQRTLFYSIVTRLFLLSITGDDEDFPNGIDVSTTTGEGSQAFKEFMEPFDKKLRETSLASFTAEDAAGFCRDLRGVCEGCTLRAPYEYFLYWMVNRPTTLERCRIYFITWQLLTKFINRSDIVIPILKLLNEIVTNKRDRILGGIGTSGTASSIGLVLFKIVGNVLSTATPALLPVQGQPPALLVNAQDLYKGYYKVIAILISIVNNTIGSDAMNLGQLITAAFQDQTLHQIISVCMQLVLAIPPSDLQAYLESMTPLYSFIHLVTTRHIEFVRALCERYFLADYKLGPAAAHLSFTAA